jgi:NADPH:quinone reductase-like Zn-dependent oxidoreductase
MVAALAPGSSGAVGVFVVQLAQAAGAHVVGVDADDRLDLLTSLGVDEVVDYIRQDFTDTAEPYDLVVDIPGNRSRSASPRRTADSAGLEDEGGG